MKVEFSLPKIRDTKIRAFADVTVADGIIVRGFRVADGSNGVFAAVPSKSINVGGEQRYWHLVAFTSPEIRDRFLAELLEDYHRWRKSEIERISPSAPAAGKDEAAAEPPF
jgi:DNA-binding cell septation regulator SpoVG